MNCRPGQLAMVVGRIPGVASFQGQCVRVEEPVHATWPSPITGPTWTISPFLRVQLTRDARVAGGHPAHAGEWGSVHCLPDCILKPLDDPGPDAVDETLRQLERTT